MASALADLHIVDFSRVLAGPLATMLLGDLGADVQKIERPPYGDDTRSWMPPVDAHGNATYFASVNRNKHSEWIDFSTPEGAATAFVLDPATGEQAVQRTWQSAQVSSQALRQGFGQLSRAEAEQLAGLGVTEAQASQRFAQIAQAGELTKTLEGETAQFNRQDSLDFAAGNAPAQQKLARRQQERTAVFSEGGGFASDRRGMVGLGSADM